MSIHARIARIATELARAVLVELRRLSPADLHALTFGPSRRKLPPSRAPAKPKSRRGARAALERDLDRVLGATPGSFPAYDPERLSVICV